MPREVEARRLLNYMKHPAGWFGTEYGFNIYRGCQHGCIYCDSRSECYHVDDFDNVAVKVNAPQLLREELARKRNRRAVIGTGAMSDPYIPLELEYKLTRQCLEIIAERRFPVNIWTKSNLILRDIDVLERLAEVYACVQFTITTTDDELAAITEPHAPPPSKRFEAMGILASVGVKVGLTMMPLLPYINESAEDMRAIVQTAAAHGATFIYPAFGMTLRDRQRAYYYDKLDAHFPGLRAKYEKRFKEYYRAGVTNYKKMKTALTEACKDNDIFIGMPMYQQQVTSVQLGFLNNTHQTDEEQQ